MRLRNFFLLFFCLALNKINSGPELPLWVEQACRRFKQEHRLPGLAVAVYYQGKPYYINLGFARPGQGMRINENTLFDIASVTKVFVSTTLALQVLRNRMRLNDPLRRHFPFLRNHPRAPVGHITLEQLATHTSSLPREARIKKQTKRRVLRALLRWRPSYPPGTKSLYSNLGFKLLRFAIENSAHKKFSMILRDDITGPLGMNSTFLHVPPHARFRLARGFDKSNKPLRKQKDKIAGSLKSTSADLLKFLMANMGVYGPADLQNGMKFAQRGRFRANHSMVQGLAWQNFTKDGLTIIDKNGGVPGYASWLGWAADQQVGIVLLANKPCGPLTNFGRRLVTKLAKKE